MARNHEQRKSGKKAGIVQNRLSQKKDGVNMTREAESSFPRFPVGSMLDVFEASLEALLFLLFGWCRDPDWIGLGDPQDFH